MMDWILGFLVFQVIGGSIFQYRIVSKVGFPEGMEKTRRNLFVGWVIAVLSWWYILLRYGVFGDGDGK